MFLLFKKKNNCFVRSIILQPYEQEINRCDVDVDGVSSVKKKLKFRNTSKSMGGVVRIIPYCVSPLQ